MDDLLKYMKALVLLQVNGSGEDDERSGPDVVLSQAGFTNPEIAELLHRTPAAVQKSIERARKAHRPTKAAKPGKARRKAKG